ncbi:putative ribonuclease H-like domain-containing protein [Tanacetum coccineum]
MLLSPQQVVIGDKKDITGKISPNIIVDQDYPHRALKHKGIVDSGCSRHMTGYKAYLAEYQDFYGGPVAFGGSKGYITGKGKIKTGKLDFEDVCFVKELQHFNLFSVSQICDKKNKVLFTDSECLVLSPEFKLPDENQVLLRIPRQNNMYSFNLENIVPSGGLACLIAKATIDESNKWHRRLGHVNFKNLNKLVKGNLVRGLPSKIFQNDHTCVACQKGKQHKASCKAKSVSSISQPLQLLHMDLFGPTSVRSLNHKTYCLVITDDFSRTTLYCQYGLLILQQSRAQKQIMQVSKGPNPNWALCILRVSSFDIGIYSDSDYAGEILTGKSTKRGLSISWQETYFLAMHKEDKYGYFYYRGKNFVAAANCLMGNYLGYRESLGRALDGTEALLLPKLFILWLAKVSIDSAKLIPLGKDSTAIEMFKEKYRQGDLEDKRFLVSVRLVLKRHPQNCDNLWRTRVRLEVDGLYRRPCAFVRKCLNEGWYTIHDENKILNTSESSDDDTNVVNAPREPFVVNQDPGVNSSQSPLQIDHNCCYECGDSLDGIFCQRCTFLHWFGQRKAEKERVLMEEKYLAVSQRIKSICNDEDDSIPLRDIIARYSSFVAITSSPLDLPTEEPEDSLIMGDEHLDTIPEKESDELIMSCVENFVPIPSESEDFSDNESECNMPVCDDFTTLLNPLFDSNDNFTSSDDKSLSDEDVPMENFKIYSNPLFDDEEIISTKIDPHSFNAESNLIESLLNRDILIDSSPKFDYLLEELSGELAHIDPIPPGIEKADFDLEEEIRLVENLLSLSPSPIPITDSDSLMEEIDLLLASDGLDANG